MGAEDFGMWAVGRRSIAQTRCLTTLFLTPERRQAAQKLRPAVLWRAGPERQRPPTLREHGPFAAELETDGSPGRPRPPAGKSENTRSVHRQNARAMFCVAEQDTT